MQHSIHIDESKLTRPERRRLKRNIESGEQQQLERIGFIFARAMESFRIEARKEFDPKVVEKFIYMAFAPEQPKETLLEKIKIWWSTRAERAKFKAGLADLEKLGKVKVARKEGVTLGVSSNPPPNGIPPPPRQ